MSKKIIGITVGTPMNPQSILEKANLYYEKIVEYTGEEKVFRAGEDFVAGDVFTFKIAVESVGDGEIYGSNRNGEGSWMICADPNEAEPIDGYYVIEETALDVWETVEVNSYVDVVLRSSKGTLQDLKNEVDDLSLGGDGKTTVIMGGLDDAEVKEELYIHPLTKEKYENEVANGNIQEDTIYLTPQEYVTHKWNGTKLEITSDSGTTSSPDLKGEKGDAFKYSDFTAEQLALLKGEKGDAFTAEDFTPEQLIALKGDKGDKGDKGNPFTYEDFTPEQLESLKVKGDKGDKGDTGDKGDRGDSGVTTPVNGFFTMSVDEDGNLYVVSAEDGSTPDFEYDSASGNLYVLQGDVQTLIGNVKGPQGATGPQGPKGDQGIQGIQGPAGSDATVTSTNIINALGYIPAKDSDLSKKANDYSMEIYNGTSGNPKPVRFLTVNYSTCSSEAGVAVKVGLVSGHGNGSSYAFLEDAIIRVTYSGGVEVDNFKYYGQSVSDGGVARQYGDIFWVVDTTNKIVDFYCLMGQYARVQMTPAKRVTYSTGGTITQYTSCTVYSSGDKNWANNSDIALLSDIPKITKETWTFTLEDGSTVTKQVCIG